MNSLIRIIDTSDSHRFKKHYVGCLVLTADHKLLLQQRPHHWQAYPDYLCEFGGKIDKGESPNQAIIRELHEELGAQVDEDSLVSLGAITEDMSAHQELIHTYFWHDRSNTITGCYEGIACYFENPSEILLQPKITDGLRWLLKECEARRLIP